MSSAWLDWVVNEKIPDVEAEFNRKLNELEQRINDELLLIRNDIAQLRSDLNDLKQYVDQQINLIKQDLVSIRQDITNLRTYVDATKADLQGKIDAQAAFLVPVGGIIQWPSAVPPQGWLECNGQAFNTSQNPKLYAALGRGNVPDYRGLFLRGWAHGSGAYDPDAGRAIGSIQGDAISNQGVNTVGEFEAFSNALTPTGAITRTYLKHDGRLRSDPGGVYLTRYRIDLTRGSNVPETRPKNAAVMYIIKTDLAQSSGGTAPGAIVVSPESITNSIGYTIKITANVLPASVASQYPVSFSSQNTAVATVDSQGNVSLVGAGTTNIVASISTGLSVTIPVTSYSLLTSLSIPDPGPVTIPVPLALTVSKLPTTATEPLIYTSSNQVTATISAQGVITPLTAGTTVITVKGAVSGVQATRTITVINEVVEPVLEDIQLGVEQQMVPESDMMIAPPGCTITALPAGDDANTYILYKPIQKKLDGVWVTISG